MARPVKVGPQGGKASTRAKNVFNSENYDRLYPYVKKGHKAVFTRAAKEKEYDSLNDFLEDVMFTRSVEILGKKQWKRSSRKKWRRRQRKQRLQERRKNKRIKVLW